jgi:hypothetical protein
LAAHEEVGGGKGIREQGAAGLDPGAGECLVTAGVGVQRVAQPCEHVPEPLRHVDGGGLLAVEQAGDVRPAVGHPREDELLLAREVVECGRPGDVGLGRDVIHGRAVVAALREEALGRRLEPVAGGALVPLPPRRRRATG